ncbi:hypothetical protein EZV62_013543 [Acer yangbiense]|uniref:Ubiquitin-like protease family profile domain-containing protein n=1 Tax=Acer yangbiense TaxID=1000413 RepID=A0A5C7HZ02_9ROSI|nr:hypothetical protein EZV62_013543 [Acer yangbiense]
MENIDYEQFLKVKRNKWNEEALINVGCRLKNIATIENIIRKEGKHKEFMHGFRSRNSNKRHGKVRYRLYGFPWAVEVWAMEAVGTLIDRFGIRLQHTLPRMRCWTMKKRPRNGVQIISDIEANIHAGKVQVLEELKPTDDEVGADYWVGVDFDMSMGPQFIPLVEMKEKNELLDDGDDGGDGDGGDGGEVGEGGDRDDVGDRGTRGQKKKRKAPKQKKKASAKKQQRETVPITRLGEEDPLPSPYSLGYTRTQRDDPLSVGFTPGYTQTLPEGMDGDRINELLEAVKVLPDLMKDIVKGEVSQLPGVLKGLMQEKQSTRGQNNNEAPSTDVRDPSSHIEQAVDAQAVDANVSIEQEVSPSGRQKERDEEGLVGGDLTVSYNYALEEDRSLRLRLRSYYCFSPFFDPTRASATKRAQEKRKYEEFKKKKTPLRRNVGMEESVDKSFFVELEDQKTWLSTDHIDAYMTLLAKRMESDPDEYRHSFVLLSSEFYTKVKVEWNRIIEADNEAGSSFDALEYECPEDWIEYGRGNRPGWGRPWWLYTQLLIPCCVGEPDGHWILCKVNLLDRHIGIFDPTATKKKKKNPFERFRQVMPLRRLLPSIMNRCGFYSSRSEKPRGSMFTVGVSSNPKIPQQVDDCSCGVFIAKYAETAIVKKADWNWGQKEMADYRKELAFQIFINSVVFKSPMQQ